MLQQLSGPSDSPRSGLYIPAIMAVFSILIMAPALDEGLMLDDFSHRTRLVDPEELPENFVDTGFIQPDAGSLKAAVRDMHSFVRTAEDLEKFLDYGLCPWWTSKDFRGANFRPLDSFSHWVDYKLYPDSPALMHLHSIFWFAGVVLLLTILYRRILTPSAVAILAALLYVIDDNNYFPVMWVANRNLPHALFFSVLAILSHIAWRKNSSIAAAVLSVFWLLLSLLSTEAGIATFAFIFAYAFILDEGSFKKRLLSLVPAIAVILFWRIGYNLLGFGAAGGGFLVDPVREPIAFLKAAAVRGPLLLAGLTGLQPAEVYTMISPEAKGVHLGFAVVTIGAMVPAFVWLVRKDRVGRFWMLAMFLCIVPICATVPMNRNLLFAEIGAAALIATFIHGVFRRKAWVPVSRGGRVYAWIVCTMLICVHVPGAIAGRILSGRMFPVTFKMFYSTVEKPAEVVDEGKTLVVVNAPNPTMFMAMPGLRAWRDEQIPRRVRLLAPGFGPIKITRTGTNSLKLTSEQGDLFSVRTEKRYYYPHLPYVYEHFNLVVRSKDDAFEQGQVIRVGEMTVEILAIDERGSPAEIEVTFAKPLEDADMVWVQWNWQERGAGDYSTFAIPEVGEAKSLGGPE